LAVGQEGFASIRRPSAWNGIVGMRPTAGLVSRSGVYDGWPFVMGSLGPMARNVTDMVRLLDVMVGYDSEDPVTARGVGHVPASYRRFLDKNGLKAARIGILRESIGFESDPTSQDFAKVNAVFEKAVGELRGGGATLVDPIVIPKLKELLAKRANSPSETEESFKVFFARSAKAPFKSREEMLRSPDFEKVSPISRNRLRRPLDAASHYQYLMARDELMTYVLKVMADNKLDAIVFKAVEHQPTPIKDGVNPPYRNQWGVPDLNTFLVYVPAIVVPAGFTTDNLPAGITFLGRPYDEGTVIKLAYAYEQTTHHRRPPGSTPQLPKEP
jgi:Asp-tRNA(Asn)/Glu-tRNA(Gln) amidotransferase A subunit family amidase